MKYLSVILRSASASLILILSLLSTPPTASAAGITVTENTADHKFAQHITFTLRAASGAKITSAYLFFRVAGDEQTQAIEVAIEPDREIEIHHVHELRHFPIPPFAQIDFWWLIKDKAGDELTTARKQIEYTDTRFQWQKIGDDSLSVHWIEGHGDPAFGQAALDIAQISLKESSAELQAPLPESITIYIYDAQHNLDAAMMLTGREWVVGQAHPELGVVITAIPYKDGYSSRMARYIPHEITHLLVYQAVTPEGYRYVPEWLDEGLATANERLPTPEFTMALEEANASDQFLSLADMCVPFSPDAYTRRLAYAQSGSVVNFIRDRYGAKKIRALLAAYAGGASCASGVQDTLNISLSGLETAWRASLEPQSPWRAWANQVGVWVGLWLLSLLTAGPMIGKPQRRD